MKNEKLYICNGCAIPCIQNNRHTPSTDGDPCLKAAFIKCESHKITEVPEPVYYLDIPEEFRRWVKPELLERQGETNNAWSGDLHRLDWIKQKQPEPTKEELQKRLNTVDMELDSFEYQSSFIKKLRDIISNGKKP